MTDNSDTQNRERILKAKYEVWQYRDDGSKYLDDVESVTAVPVEELEALADKWDTHREVGNTEYAEGVQDCFSDCARELRDLIAEYRGDGDA